jgi:hypothetical protein
VQLLAVQESGARFVPVAMTSVSARALATSMHCIVELWHTWLSWLRHKQLCHQRLASSVTLADTILVNDYLPGGSRPIESNK